MANIPVNFGGLVLTAGQSATGSFAGIISLGTGSAFTPTGSTISAFKYSNGLSSNQNIIEATGVSFTIPAGATIPLYITSCSLAAGSAPVVLYT
jgi:hypothetical protein